MSYSKKAMVSGQQVVHALVLFLMGVSTLGAVTMFGAGCGGRRTRSLRAIKRPKVKIRKVRLLRMSPREVVVRVQMEVSNPYGKELPPSALSYRLKMVGVNLTHGRVQLPPIPPLAKAPVAATLRFGPVDAAKVAAKMALGFRKYYLRVTLRVKTPLGFVDIHVKKKGKLTVTGVLKRGSKSLKKRFF